ncbi:glycerol-3-phosphate dehydrogenase/oxidase [Pseudalkalibacillus caeni]|uniref:Aerobic glycerol-3-phosphate dehydrogenase n=1 Tax=Exobacillus caeni TaxID=2574798 RepID=A0A5R9F4T0_9BACL|nr:glycerol-3-phosphate dehydrogenase/oxidase [Pseudalkalibacillus caeni]TLS38527.1 glycerol-3-phosphate dehydrogenase/oxidase [Pseudalkalibacillus caeni]
MAKPFSGLQRNVIADQMIDEELDVLVIGGGITGAGILLDATVRGMNAGLIEMQDFAGGTSSRSTKLVHGGLRYLKQFEMKIVAEVGKERAIVYENAPHVTTPEWMLLPIFKGGTFGKLSTSAGLALYDRLADVKRKERRRMLNRAETIRKEPLIRQRGLKGGGYYVEYKTDDARLTLEVIKEAVYRGGKAVNYMMAEELLYEEGRVKGVRVKDLLSGERKNIKAKKIVNAAGPWVDEVREMDHSKKGMHLFLTKGVHLVFDQSRFPLQQAVYFDTPFEDNRMMFAIPRDGKTYVGTTDTQYAKDPIDPRMTEEDRDYIIDSTNYMFPGLKLKPEYVESSWAGVRPLIHEEGKDPSEISRKDEVFISDSGLITIAGGKLTGYRKMAERVVDIAAEQFKEEGYRTFPGTETEHITLSGGDVGGGKGFETYLENKVQQGIKIGFTAEEAGKLADRYGSNVSRIYEIAQTMGEEAKFHNLSLEVFVSLVYGIEEEMVATPIDYFNRRTSALYFDIDWVRKWKEPVIAYMAKRFNWTDKQKDFHRDVLEKELHDAVVPLKKK